MKVPMCGDCLIPLDMCAHSVEYITQRQRKAIETLRRANEAIASIFNTEEEEVK